MKDREIKKRKIEYWLDFEDYVIIGYMLFVAVCCYVMWTETINAL